MSVMKEIARLLRGPAGVVGGLVLALGGVALVRHIRNQRVLEANVKPPTNPEPAPTPDPDPAPDPEPDGAVRRAVNAGLDYVGMGFAAAAAIPQAVVDTFSVGQGLGHTPTVERDPPQAPAEPFRVVQGPKGPAS